MDPDNLTLLLERFPAIGILAQEFPPPSPKEEELPKQRPLDVEVLYVVGLSLSAFFHLQSWLEEKQERRLIFLESDGGAFRSLLENQKAKALLSHPQAELSLLPSGRGLDAALQTLAEKHPVKTLDVVALPSYKNSRFRSIRLKLLRKTTLTYALFMDRSHGYQPFLNFVRNAPLLASSFYLNALKGAFSGVPAIICGAGPSLKTSFETLATLENKALIFAGGSAIAAFSAAGITPHFCVAIDPNKEEFTRLKNNFLFEVPFLYSTRVHPGAFQTANGPFGYVRSGIGGVTELWIEEELGLTEPLIGEHLSSESITVTAIAVAAAQWLGCNPILLNGLDMAYTGGKRYAAGVGVEEDNDLKAVRTAADRIVSRKDQKGQRVDSAVRWIMESASLSHYAKAHKEIRFIHTTDGGIGCKGIEYQPLSEAAAEFTEEWDLRGRIHAGVASAPMPPANIPQKLQELKQSLQRIVAHLKILAKIERGSSALAELEMQEEIAYSVLFYDISTILPKMAPAESKWPVFLKLAEQYLSLIE